jgi:oligoribonuclease NrnB/cAMP/cGMP phosphodiesterase (DHH superfamily)
MLKLQSKLEWIDHHISAIKDIEVNDFIGGNYKGLRDTNYAACELTWKYFFPNDAMPEIVRMLGRYDCFGSRGTDEEQKVLEFQYGARAIISNYEEAFTWLLRDLGLKKMVSAWKPSDIILRDGAAIYKYLLTEAKQIYNNRFDLTFNGFTFAAINRERFNPINFGIDYHKDGYDGVACFWYTDHKLHFSLYNANVLVDCSAIAKQFNGGGHKGAAGFVLHSNYISDTNNLFDLKATLGSMVTDRSIF